jgi:hypothetical protein
MMAFRDTLQVCGLVDLGFTGVPFTYDNKRQGNKNVKVRLDRAIVAGGIFIQITVSNILCHHALTMSFL